MSFFGMRPSEARRRSELLSEANDVSPQRERAASPTCHSIEAAVRAEHTRRWFPEIVRLIQWSGLATLLVLVSFPRQSSIDIRCNNLVALYELHCLPSDQKLPADV